MLRRKVDRPFGCSDIQTVRGAGYRLTLPAYASVPIGARLALLSAAATPALVGIGGFVFLEAFGSRLRSSVITGVQTRAPSYRRQPFDAEATDRS
jgi:hypothetical protein